MYPKMYSVVLPCVRQRELIDLSVAAVRCLGFTCGVFHVECKYGVRGARLVEVNCRMGGGCVRDINLLVRPDFSLYLSF